MGSGNQSIPHATSALPPWPGAGNGHARAAFVGAVTDAIGRGEWSEAADVLRGIPPAEMPVRLAVPFLVVALQRDEPALVDAAVQTAIVADVPGIVRARLAWRLAFAERPEAAWHVLHADPAAMADPEAFALITPLLARIIRSPKGTDALRAAARALARRYGNQASVEPTPVPIKFGQGPGGAHPGSLPARLLLAPGTPPAVMQAYQRAVAESEALLAQRKPPDVRELRDVFVNRLGQIWLSDGKVVRQSGQAIPAASRAAAETAPQISEAVFGTETHNNIYHWLADWLPSLAWRFEPDAPDIPVLIRDDAAPFVVESLRMVGGPRLALHAVGDALRVGRLLLGSFGAGTIAPLGAHRRMLDALRLAVDAAAEPPGGVPRRLYISRRDSMKRRMENEPEVEAALARLGFRAVTLTGMPFAQQARLVRGAEIIAGPHGAGLAHLLLAEPGTAVFEIMPGTVTGALMTTCMSRLSRLMGHRHLIWLEASSPLAPDWTVNLQAMLPAVEAFAAEADQLR